MSKKPQKGKQVLLQIWIKPTLAERFYASREYQVHENISAALRAILDRVLPTLPESQGKNEPEATSAIAG